MGEGRTVTSNRQRRTTKDAPFDVEGRCADQNRTKSIQTRRSVPSWITSTNSITLLPSSQRIVHRNFIHSSRVEVAQATAWRRESSSQLSRVGLRPAAMGQP